MEPLLEWSSTQTRSITARIIDPFFSWLLVEIRFKAIDRQFSLIKHENIATTLPFSSAIIYNKCDEPSSYTPSELLHNSLKLFYYHSQADGLEEMKGITNILTEN